MAFCSCLQAQEAKALGLVDEVVPKESLLPAAEKVMQSLVSSVRGLPLSVCLMRESLFIFWHAVHAAWPKIVFNLCICGGLLILGAMQTPWLSLPRHPPICHALVSDLTPLFLSCYI